MEFVGVLLDSFSDDAPGMLRDMRDGLAAGDSETVRRAAHTLKPNAGTFGATSLSELCADLESHAREADLRDGLEMLGLIEGRYASAREELERWRAGLADQ